jgi:plasmid stabilization system protein ParE
MKTQLWRVGLFAWAGLFLFACAGGAQNTASNPKAADSAAAKAPAADPAQATQPGGCPGVDSGAQVVSAGLKGQAAAEALMARWKDANPSADWEAEERLSRTFLPAADNSHLLAKDSQRTGHTYRNVSERDLLTWKRETERLVVAGSKVFHSADELESTIAVSCDMCHPNAANTHPETYPKFQSQIGKVVLLRDMINWCIVNAVRGEQMDADDPRMRAMEAYIISQRTGTKLVYGKH